MAFREPTLRCPPLASEGLLLSEAADRESRWPRRALHRLFPSLRRSSPGASRAQAQLEAELSGILQSLCFGSDPTRKALLALPLELSFSRHVRSICLFALGDPDLPDERSLLSDDLVSWDERLAVSRAARRMAEGHPRLAGSHGPSCSQAILETLEFLRAGGLATWPSPQWRGEREALALSESLPPAGRSSRRRSL